METSIILTGKKAKMWAMMEVLDSYGAFDISYGSVKVDFDGQKNISNIKIEKNYRPNDLTKGK